MNTTEKVSIGWLEEQRTVWMFVIGSTIIWLFFVGCKRDSNGYYWITGRTDDCMNVSGHLLSTAQIESALVEHEAVTEAAVVSWLSPFKIAYNVTHWIQLQIFIFATCTLMQFRGYNTGF